MADKQISILLSLKDKFTSPLNKITNETRKQQAQMNKAKSTINSWANNANSKFLAVNKSAAKLAGVLGTLGGVISIAGLKAFTSEAIELAQAQVDAETKLEAVLGNIPSLAAGGASAISSAKQELMDYASQLQAVGVIGDEVTLSGMQQLATYQLSTESIKGLSKGMTDLLAQTKGLNATQEDAVSVANMIGKAMSGNASALTKVGIVMSDTQKNIIQTGTEAERAAVLAEVLAQNVGGVNEALANTDQGKIQQAANAYGDFQEEVGKKLLAVKANTAAVFTALLPQIQEKVLAITDRVAEQLNKINEYVNAHREQIAAAIDKIASVVGTAYKVISKAVSWVIKHGNILIPILAGIYAGFAAFNIVTTIAAIFTTLTTVIQGVAAAGGILNAVMLANPFVLVAVAIAAVVAAGVALYKNWDTVKAAAQKLFEKVKSVFEKIKAKIASVFDSVKQKVKPVLDWISDKLQKILTFIDNVKSGAAALGDWFTGGGGGNTVSDYGGKALGTSYWQGGLTRVNEHGGEILNLPSGTQVIPHDVSVKAAGGTTVNVNLTVAGNVIGNRDFMEQTGQYVSRQILLALGTV